MIAGKRRFFHWELEFPEVFFDKHGQPKREQAGFDAVVGNPPWIRQEMFSEDKVALKRYTVYHGVADLYTYFVELGNTYLKDGGHFGFITPNKFVRANYGAPLRKFLIERVRLERLVNFSDLPVFQEATTYPMIMLTSKQPVDESHVKYTLLKQLHPDNIVDDIKNGESLVHPSALTEEHWHLNGTNIQTIFVEVRLANQPEQIDVIYDLLVYLAEQMIDFNKQSQQAVEDFAFDLKAELSDSQLQKISRLWTPLGAPKEGDKEAERRRTEAQQVLGSLAEEQLDLRDDIGKLNEEQWQWLLRGRLSGGYRLSNLIKAYRAYQPSIAAIDNRIATTNKVIDEIVYRLYGLTPEEIALVEGK